MRLRISGNIVRGTKLDIIKVTYPPTVSGSDGYDRSHYSGVCDGKVMAVTNPAGVAGGLELLECSPISAMVIYSTKPIFMLTP